MRVGLRSFALASVVLLLAGGCRTSGLAFRVDERVEIISPEQRSEVTLPFDLVWTVKDFNIVGPDGSEADDAGWFGVLVDGTPMPPGEGPDYFARDDDSCRGVSGCPDAAYLADRNVFLTKATTFPVTALVDTRPVDRQGAADEHEITVILLNGKSERIGESAFKVEFTVDRGQGS